MKIYIFAVYLFTLCLASCSKDTSHITERVNPVNEDSPPPHYNSKYKIRQSIKSHDDNVNGVFLRQINKIQEVVYYFYNKDNLLDSLAVFSDTTKNLMTKSMKLQYVPAEKRIKANFYEWQKGEFSMNIYYDQNFRLTEISMDSNGIKYGIFYQYHNNQLQQIRMEYGNTTLSTNMIYDSHFNLQEYITFYPTVSPVRVQYDYDLSYPVDKTFDIKFASIEIKFLYEGGVNIIHLMGLNMGEGNKHIVTKRIETNIRDTTAIRNQYEFEYTKDQNERLIERKIIFNKNTEARYEYKY